VAGNLNFNANRSILLNSYDVEARSESSSISGIVNVAATVGENESRSTSSVAGITFDDLKIAETAESVAERAYRGLNQNELDVGSYTAILGREAVMEMMFHVGLAASSSMLINHQSPFMDKLGEQIFDSRITITDAVLDPNHYASQNFDFDGEPSRDITYIEDGILKEFAYNRRNAMKLGVETNGRGVGGFALFRSPSFTPGSKNEEGLIESVDDGVYVTNLWYSNFVNMPDGSVTGLTKDGLFKIENGEIVGSLRNMRFTDTLFSMFGSSEPGNNIKQQLHSTYGTLFGLAGKIPSVKLDSFNFSSKGKH
jgi:PmbA protein